MRILLAPPLPSVCSCLSPLPRIVATDLAALVESLLATVAPLPAAVMELRLMVAEKKQLYGCDRIEADPEGATGFTDSRPQ